MKKRVLLSASGAPPDRRGFSLVEVTVALGLAAFGLLAIFALLPTGVNSSSDSVNSTLAAGLASAIVNDMQAATLGGTSPIYGLRPDTTAPNTTLYLKADGTKQSSAGAADFSGSVAISTNAQKISDITIRISWPAAAANPVNSFETVTALDRDSVQ